MKEQNETSMSWDEISVGQNQNSFDQVDFIEQEAKELKSFEKNMKLKRF